MSTVVLVTCDGCGRTERGPQPNWISVPGSLDFCSPECLRGYQERRAGSPREREGDDGG